MFVNIYLLHVFRDVFARMHVLAETENLHSKKDSVHRGW